MARAHLIGAYGMFWDRHEVSWRPGSGPAAWQLLGHVNRVKPKVRVCDFRKAQGFYILFDDFRANYVGLARGRHGIGARLRTHNQSAQRRPWNRFCFFTFDDVVDDRSLPGWSKIKPREALRNMSADLVLRECEALLITVLGSDAQNQMNFQHAQRWEQLRESDFLPGGIAARVAADGYTDPRLLGLARA
ncbi:MAG TPA: hypothetical protein VHC43_14200 [Mycobacteriales bacterium]|nr:hypothetical protein [Mycobacteriales bacterium]